MRTVSLKLLRRTANLEKMIISWTRLHCRSEPVGEQPPPHGQRVGGSFGARDQDLLRESAVPRDPVAAEQGKSEPRGHEMRTILFSNSHRYRSLDVFCSSESTRSPCHLRWTKKEFSDEVSKRHRTHPHTNHPGHGKIYGPTSRHLMDSSKSTRSSIVKKTEIRGLRIFKLPLRFIIPRASNAKFFPKNKLAGFVIKEGGGGLST